MERPQRVTREEVLNQARELAESYGESLTLTAFRRETGLSQQAIYDLFGNWKNLRIAVGLTPEAPRARNKISKDSILELMQKQVEEHGELLTEFLFLKATGLSSRMIADRFGSWGNLRAAFGLKRRAKIQRYYSDEELLEDLYRVYRWCRGRPVFAKHRVRGGQIAPATIQFRFGSWSWACRRFLEYLRDHNIYDDQMPLPEELEQKFRGEFARKKQ